MVEATFKVGTGHTGSGYPIRGRLFVWDPESREWVPLDDLTAERFGIKIVSKDWYVSSTKKLCDLKVDLPEGVIIKHYYLYRKYPATETYYTVRDGELVELRHEYEDRVMREDGKDRVVLRVLKLPEVGIEIPLAAVVKGPNARLLTVPGFSEVKNWYPVEGGDVEAAVERAYQDLIAAKRPKAYGRVRGMMWRGGRASPENVEDLVRQGGGPLLDSLLKIVVSGDVYEQKEELKKLGFRWNPADSEWDRDITTFCANGGDPNGIIEKLRDLGIEISDGVDKVVENCRIVAEGYRPWREACKSLERRVFGEYPALNGVVKFWVSLDGACLASPTSWLDKDTYFEVRDKLGKFGCKYERRRGAFVCPIEV